MKIIKVWSADVLRLHHLGVYSLKTFFIIRRSWSLV